MNNVYDAKLVVPSNDRQVFCTKKMLDGSLYQFCGTYDAKLSKKERLPMFLVLHNGAWLEITEWQDYED